MCRDEFSSLNCVEITPSLDEFLQLFRQLFAIGAYGLVAHANYKAIFRSLS